MQSAAFAAGAAWLPAFRIDRAHAATSCRPPPGFPSSIDLYLQGYENWAEAIRIDSLWTCAPRTAAEVLEVVNWAHRHRYRVRPRGAMHGWSPLAVTPDMSCNQRVVLLDTTRHLTGLKVAHGSHAELHAQAGASLGDILELLEENGLGLASAPAVGAPTIGGVLAIGGHGACLPAAGEVPVRGQTYGSLSNLVVEITAVVWSRKRGRYVLKTFERSDPRAKAFLAHLGRAFVTDVRLRVGRNQNLRCQSHVDIPAKELFAPPGASGRTFASFIEAAGRAEAIWFPFTDKPWLKVWSVSPTQPPGSRRTTSPYNYPFSDHIPQPIADLAQRLVDGARSVTPTFGEAGYAATVGGLAAFAAYDLWGPSKDTLLYIRPTTLRFDELGHAVLTHRRNIQRVVSEFVSSYSRFLKAHADRGEYPINGPLEVRACGLDHAHEAGVPGAESPALAATTPTSRGPRFDCAVWMNVLTIAGTPGEYAFYRDMERFMRRTYRGSYAAIRPEWTKGWAVTAHGQWTDRHALTKEIPRQLSANRPTDAGWRWARETLNAHDPHRVFSNEFLDRLLPGSG